MLTTRVNGVTVQAVRHPLESVWEVTIMPERDVMDRPFELRSTYAGLDFIHPLTMAMIDVDNWDNDGRPL